MSAPMKSEEKKAIEGFFTERLNDREIRVRESDGYICVTNICRASGENKKMYHYMENDISVGYMREVASRLGKSDLDLVEVVKNVAPKDRGTWAHPLIAIDVARWASPKLALEMNTWFLRYVKGDLTAVQELIKRSEIIRETPIALAASAGEMVVVEGDGKSREDLLALIKRLQKENAKKDAKIERRNKKISSLERKVDEQTAIMKDQSRRIDELLKRSERTLEQNDELKVDVRRLHVKVDRIAFDSAPKYGLPNRELPALYIYADRKTKSFPYLAIRAQEKTVKTSVQRQEKQWDCELTQLVRISYYANTVTLYKQFRDIYGKYITFSQKSPSWFQLNELADRDNWGEEEMADCIYALASDRFNQ